MAKLSFLDQLDESQLEYARRIGEKAKEMGIPPSLAISIAYHESRLNPAVGRGSSGEFGIMQVMPGTGKGMGYTNQDLADPDKNIEAGLKYLKQNLDAFDGDARLATIGYNAGTDSKFFSGGELPKVTEDYLRAMKGYGAYSAQAREAELVDVPPASPPQPGEIGATPGERFLGGAAGAGVGALISGAQGLSNARTGMLANRAGREETARINAQRAAGLNPPAPGAVNAPGTTSALAQPTKPALGSTIMRQPIPSGGPDAGRLAPGQTGTMPYNYAKAAGLTDIEAGQAKDMTKQAGGVHDLTTQRREGLNRIQTLFPTERYVENPRFGGIMTPDQGAGGGPRQSFKVQGATKAADLPPNFMAGPAAPPPQGSLVQLPPRQPIPTTPIPPKPPSGLDAVSDLFKSMMRPFTEATKTVGRYAVPPLAGLSAGLDLAEVGGEYNKPVDQRDYTRMGLKAASAVGGGLSMFPPTAPVGIPLTLGASAVDFLRSNPNFLKEKMQGMADVPLLDEMTAPRF